MSNSPDYQYKGNPLTPKIAAELIVEIFSGQVANRPAIVAALTQAHLARGGIEGGDRPNGTVKKALNRLKIKGLASNPSKAMWQIAVDSEPHQVSAPVKKEKPERQKKADPTYGAEKEMGRGSEYVYVYFFPSDLSTQQQTKERRYKVGKAKCSALQRIMDQIGTSHPEPPCILRFYRTNNCNELEAAFHNILRLRSKKVAAPGKEWFFTSPEELDAIFHFIEEERFSRLN